MPLNLFADECVHKRIVDALRRNGYQVDYISETNPGLSDSAIVDLVSKKSAILITEDSDFGEWVFVHGYKNIGVVFLRYKTDELESIIQAVLKVILKFEKKMFKKFIVITSKKYRIREID